MKRFLISFLGLALVLGVSAQDNQDKRDNQKRERKDPLAGMTVEQKAQTVTDRMATAYGLSAEQRTKLLDLNTRKLSQRPEKPFGKDECKPCPDNKDKKCNKDCKDKKDKKDKKNKPNKDFKPGKDGKPGKDCKPGKDGKDCKPCPQQPGKPGMKPGVNYMRELKGIMTEDQFKAFMTDRAIERQMFGNQGGPRRPHMDKMNKRDKAPGKAQCPKSCDCKSK